MPLLLYCHTTTLLLPHNTAAIAAQRRCYCRTTPLLLLHNADATAAQRCCYAAQRHCRPISLCAAVLTPLP